MFTLEIENFKCFHGLQQVPVNRLTVLVGCNSSGKSSVVQALWNRRIFDIPGYGSKYCPLHLKRGSRIRTHLWHTDGERRLYVVYCGPHLPTANVPK